MGSRVESLMKTTSGNAGHSRVGLELVGARQAKRRLDGQTDRRWLTMRDQCSTRVT